MKKPRYSIEDVSQIGDKNLDFFRYIAYHLKSKSKLLKGLKMTTNRIADASKSGDQLIQELQAQLDAKEREIAWLKSCQSGKESRFQALFNTMPEGFALHEIILDRDGKPFDYRFIEINLAFERLTGLKYEDVVWKTVREVIPKIETYWIETCGRVAIEGTPIRFEQYSVPLGRWYEGHAYRTAPEQFAVMFTDITERKQSDAALKDISGKFESAKLSVEQERKRFRDVLDMLPAYLILLSPDYRVPFANSYFEDRFGKSDGRRCYEYLFERSEPCENCESFRVFENNTPHRWEWVGPDGRNYDIYDFPFTDTDGSQLIMEMGIDITERKKAESALQELNQELEQHVAERTAELSSSKERLQLTASIAERLLRSENPQTIIEDLCRLVMKNLDCQFFSNYLVELPGERMHLNAFAGIPSEAVSAIQVIDFGVSVCGCVAKDGERIIAENIQNSHDLRTRLVKKFGVQAYCCHPLIAQGSPIGTLSFGTKTRTNFTEDEIALMKSISDQVAVAMQRLMTEKELRQLNETLEVRVVERTEIAVKRTKQLQSLAVELIEAEEKERRRIADLLHDDLQQMLAAAKMQLQSLPANTWHDPVLENVTKILQESIAKTRQLSHELCPAVLQTSGIIAALQWLARHMDKQFGFTVEIEASFYHEIENEPLKIFIFGAVRELLFNCVKHSGVKNARVAISINNGSIIMKVTDNGKGFDPSILSESGMGVGSGLLMIRERASFIGGNLIIESEPGQGSRFHLTVPVQPADEESVLVPSEAPLNAVAQKTSSHGA